MFLTYQDLTIRNATAEDAPLLERWWNDGALMAHAGYPNGTGEKAAHIAQKIAKDDDATHRRLILEAAGTPIGEMSYRNLNDGSAEIGIKICEMDRQEKGYGRKFLSLLIAALFRMGYEKVVLDTNLQNRRAQHVYESLGFVKTAVHENAFQDQLGQWQTSVDYELLPQDFITFAP